MPSNTSKPNRERKQREATDRQTKRDARSAEDQLKLIEQRPGKSKRELARIKAFM